MHATAGPSELPSEFSWTLSPDCPPCNSHPPSWALPLSVMSTIFLECPYHVFLPPRYISLAALRQFSDPHHSAPSPAPSHCSHILEMAPISSAH